MNERLFVRLKSKAFLSKMFVLAAMVSIDGFGSGRGGAVRQGAEIGLASPLGPEVAGCRVELRVAKQEYAVGEDIALHIILHNVSTNEIGVSWRTDYGNYRFTITDPMGSRVPLSANGLKRKHRAQYSIFGTTLPPGRPFKNGIFLNGHYEMTNSGSYTVTVSQEVKPKGGGDGPAWVPSAPLTITISRPKTNQTAVPTPPSHSLRLMSGKGPAIGTDFSHRPPYYASITKTKTDCFGRPWLLLGEEVGTDGAMNFTVTVRSEFPGLCRWTQLVNQYRHRDEIWGAWYRTTGGDFYADGGEFYLPNVSTETVGPARDATLPFGDGPGNPVGLSVTSAVDTFETYLRFKPDGVESIWVTLGRVDWSWDVTANNPLGYPYNNLPSNWTISRSFVPQPAFVDDTSFPRWYGYAYSIGE